MAVDVRRVTGQNPAYGRPVCLPCSKSEFGTLLSSLDSAAIPADARDSGFTCSVARASDLVPADALARQSVAQRTLRWSELIAGTGRPGLGRGSRSQVNGAFEAGADVADADGGLTPP